MIKVYFFGDSICTGQGLSLHRGWVTRISETLSDRALVANASANGRTTRQALEAMPYEVQSHEPDVLIVQFGLNDCNCWETDRGLPRVSWRAFEANLMEIVDRARAFGVKELILNTNHPTNKGLKYDCMNASYNHCIRTVARAKKTILNDMEKAFNESKYPITNLLLSDGIHLSDKGHELYFSRTYPIVEKAIEKAGRNNA